MDTLVLFLVAIGAGFLGALLGLGGGIIIVPILTLVYGIDIRYAIAASLISIVATSSGAAASFLKDHLTNLRLGVLLEVGTVCGAMVGFLISSFISTKYLFLLFSFFLIYASYNMLRVRYEHLTTEGHPWAEKLKLNGVYNERGVLKSYYVQNVPLGLLYMGFAGVLSALLGIGSGIFKVMAMDGAMKLPIKISSATSNFMIGVTAAGSAGAYLLRGDIKPAIAAPIVLGIIVGSYFGARMMLQMPAQMIRKIFVGVMILVALQMMYKGFTL